MLVRVEMLGLSRLVTGEREVSLELDDKATYRDLVRALSEHYPALVGNVIQSDRKEPAGSQYF